MKQIAYIFIMLILLTSFTHAKELINVGIYQNKPKIFLDQNRIASGFFIDVLNEIARVNDWELNYVPCKWQECLDKLDSGTLDLMPDVAYMKKRAERFSLGRETVLSSWSVLYRHAKSPIDSVIDLKAKKIAVLRGSIQESAIKELLIKFDVKPMAYVEVDDYETAFTLLRSQELDAVIVNRFYELNHTLDCKAVKTNIVIEPAMMKFAFNKSKSYLTEAADRVLYALKTDANSIYYDAEKRWLLPKPSTTIPRWIKVIIGVGFLIVFILTITVIIFRKMVRKTSEALLQKEEIMIVQSRHAAMGEMIGMIAHQWRQPLSVISMSGNNIGLSIELEETVSPQVLQEHLKILADEVSYLSHTIDDFRNFFKPNKDKKEEKISVIIDHLRKLVDQSLESYAIRLNIQHEKDFTMRTYPNELLQVLLNLVNNAKDMLKVRQIKNAQIQIKSFDDDLYFYLQIEDNAGGIPKALIEKIGTQYFTTKGDEGTGLGLYMSKVIVEQHLSGKLTWKNCENGACFTIALLKSAS